MTGEPEAEVRRLRSTGLTYSKIAAQLGISLTKAWAVFRPKNEKPKPKQPVVTRVVVTRRPPSVPIRKTIKLTDRTKPQPTKPELYRQFAVACANTARLA
jgi:hypothetical protein